MAFRDMKELLMEGYGWTEKEVDELNNTQSKSSTQSGGRK